MSNKVTAQRLLKHDGGSYVVVRVFGGLEEDQVTVFSGPRAEERARAYIALEHPSDTKDTSTNAHERFKQV